MNDVTKARAFLRAHKSKLETKESFQSMLAEAEKRYQDLRLLKQSNQPLNCSADQELAIIVDLGVLRFLKKHNRLPDKVGEILNPELSNAQKMELARKWYNA